MSTTTTPPDAASIGVLLDQYARTGNLPAFEQLVTSTSASIIQAIGANQLATILGDLTQTTRGTDQFKEVGDFLAKAGPSVSSDAIAKSVESFALSGNLASVESVLHNISATTFQSVNGDYAGRLLVDIAQNASQNASAANQAVADFLKAVNGNIASASITKVIESFALSGNLAGVETVLHGTPATTFHSVNGDYAGQLLVDIAQNASASPATTNQAITDFLKAVNGNIASAAITKVIESFALSGNLSGVETVLHAMPANTFQSVNGDYAGQLLVDIAQNASASPAATNQAITDFLKAVNGNIASAAITKVIESFALSGNLSGVETVLHAMPANTFQSVNGDYAGQLLVDIAQNVSMNITATNQAVGDFLKAANGNISSDSIAKVLGQFSTNNLSGVEVVLHGVSGAALQSISGTSLGNVLFNISHQLNTISGGTAAVNQAVTDLLAKAGTVIDPNAVGQALDYFAHTENFAGVEAILHSSVPAQAYSVIGGTEIGRILYDLSQDTYNQPQNTAAVNQAVTDLLAKAGTVIDPNAVGQALDYFAHTENFAGVEAILHSSVPAQAYSVIGGTEIGRILYDLSQDTYNQPQNTAAVNQAVTDLLAKAGTVIDPNAVGQALDYFAHTENFAGVEAILHSSVPAQAYSVIGGTEIGRILYDLSQDTYNQPQNTAAVNQAVTDLLAKAGTVIDPNAVGQALDYFAHTENFAGVEAILHSSVPAQAYSVIGGTEIGRILYDLSQDTYNQPQNTAAVNQAVYDLVLKTGSSIDPGALGQALDYFAHGDNLGGVHAILHNSSATTITNIGASELDVILNDIVTHSQPAEASVANQAVADFLVKANTVIDHSALGQALSFYAAHGNDNGIEAVINNISDATAKALSGNGYLYGGIGNDTLTSAGLSEHMYGGNGNDTFVAATKGAVTIGDFSTANDRLDLSKLLDTAHPTDATISKFIFETTSNGNTTILVDAKGGGDIHHATAVAVLTGVSHVDIENLYHTGHIVA